MARDGVLTFQVGTADISELGGPLCVMSPSSGCLLILWWQLRRATRSQLLGGPAEGEGPSHRGILANSLQTRCKFGRGQLSPNS